MAVEETKHDLMLKRVQVAIAILAGLASLVLGVYGINKAFFSPKEEPEKIVVVQQAPAAAPGDQIRSALDDVGATWIKKLGKPESSESPQ